MIAFALCDEQVIGNSLWGFCWVKYVCFFFARRF